MKNLKTSFFGRFLSFFTLAVFILSQNILCGFAVAATAKSTTDIKHKPIKYFVSEKRISLDTIVKDTKGVELVRCYFRAQGEADYVFVPMNTVKQGAYNCVLPAPSKTTEAIEYVFLVVNKAKQVVKTQTYTVARKKDKKAPAWQQASAKGDITVSTELAQAPSELAGFSDSITMDVVESTARFGVVAGGLYTSSTSTGGTIATTAGIVTASAGFSTAVIVGAAVAVGAAAAVGAGAGGSSSSSSSSGGSGGLTDVVVSTSSITLTLRDHMTEDGDQVDLYLNGAPVASDILLTNAGVTYHVTLISGTNTLTIHADNEGTAPTNTSELTISNVTSGNSVQTWVLTTGQDATMTITH